MQSKYRHFSSGALCVFSILFACSRSDNDVGTIQHDSGPTGGSGGSTDGVLGSGGSLQPSQTGGSTSAPQETNGGTKDASQDPPACSAGTVRATPGSDGEFTAFCGLPCTTTSDCPDGSHCVELAGAAAASAGLVCVSATNPPPMANPMGVIWDLMDNCLDSNLLALHYIDFGNHVAGREITFCLSGCIQSPVVDGGGNRPHCQ